MSTKSTFHSISICLLCAIAGYPLVAADKNSDKGTPHGDDPYAEFVWPPPPDEARIKLEAIYTGRADVEAKSKWKRRLMGASPQEPTDRLRKPHAVEFDSRGRILVSDWASQALLRFDRQENRYDVVGTRGALPLKQPLGLAVGPDDSIFVADIGLKQVIEFDPEDKLRSVFGRPGELMNPTDVALAPDGKTLYVADSKAHKIMVFDRDTGELQSSFGEQGEAEGQFQFPTSLAINSENQIFVVDQINARVQVFDLDGSFVDTFGAMGYRFRQLRPPQGHRGR